MPVMIENANYYTIKEIADNFGFESSSYLISYFRRHTGVTPGNFRKHNFSSESLK